MLIVNAGEAKCLISASQGCSEGETRPAVMAAACTQKHKNLSHPYTCDTPWKMVTFCLWVKHRTLEMLWMAGTVAYGETWCLQTKQARQIFFFLPSPHWIITWLFQNCKHDFQLSQPLSLKTSRGKNGTVWQDCYGALYFLEEVQAAPGTLTLSSLVTRVLAVF